ncbi:MAG: lysophospholipase [Acidimicrobiales bacterium]
MPNPSDAFAGASTTSEAASRRGVTQFRREWKSDSPKATALLVHGIAEHSGRYEHVGATLAAAGYDTRAIDNHGFGRSGGKRGHVDSMDVFLDDVEDNLAELRMRELPTILIAHSLGGLIAFSYAVSDRPQPDVYLLSGPAIGAERPAWQRIMAPVMGRIVPKLFITDTFDGALLSTDPDVGAAYVDDPLRVTGSTAALGMAAFAAMKTCNERIDRLRVPTMVVHGGDDQIVPVEYTAPIGAQESATRIVLDGLRHEVLNEPSWADTMASLIEFADAHIEG